MISALPTFLCVGAQKAGTTSLQAILRQHPDVFLVQPKEAHFFDRDERYAKGIEWYRKQYFSNHTKQKAIGDITPEYMFCHKSPSRIHNSLSDVKLIFLLRNPVERAYSQYLMSVRRAIEDLSFADAITAESERIRKGDFEYWHFSYLSRGYYARQISRYMSLFPTNNMFFIIFETDFLKNRRDTINRLLSFLEIETVELNLNKKANPARLPRFELINDLMKKDNVFKKVAQLLLPNKTIRRRISKSIDKANLKTTKKKELDQDFAQAVFEKYFQDDVNKLEVLIGRDLDVWRQPRKQKNSEKSSINLQTYVS